MTAIVTDAHYRMAVALIRDLGQAGIRVIACDYEDVTDNPGFASKYVDTVVTVSRQDTLAKLRRLCKSLEERPVLLPVGARTQELLAAHRSEMLEVCGLALPTPASLKLYNDKAAVAALAAELGIPTPHDDAIRPDETLPMFFDRVTCPAVVKPACGEQFGLHAKERYRIVRDSRELAMAYDHFQTITGEAPLVQEYLPGDGAGCSVLCRDGEILAEICHRRIREYPVAGGPSSCAEVCNIPALHEAAAAFVAATGYTGLAMFEFKAGADGQWRLLEINPRVWGTFPLTRVSGSNFSRMWYALAADEPLPVFIPPRPVRMAYYPSDLAAMLGYLRAGRLRPFFSGLVDLIRAKNGLRERGDPAPYRVYIKSLNGRGRA